MSLTAWKMAHHGMLNELSQWVEDTLPTLEATHALLRLKLSEDICLARKEWDRWAGSSILCDGDALLVATAPLRNPPDALRCAVSWHLQQPDFKEAKAIVRKTRATQRGAYLQVMVTTAPHTYQELVWLSIDVPRTEKVTAEVKALPGPAAKDYPHLLTYLAPERLITFGQEHLFYRDLSELLKALLGPTYWPGVWRVPLEQAITLREQLAHLTPLLTSGTITCDLVSICEEKETSCDHAS